jgi:hypothetical protein
MAKRKPTMTVDDYNAMVERHLTEFKNWLATQPAGTWDDPNRTPDEYFEEYHYQFAVVAYMAQDANCPLADKWLIEYSKVPDSLIELMG